MTKRICVIGAGLAGGVVASQLSDSGYDVVLVDLGKEPVPYEGDDEDWECERPKAAFTRGIGIGGTSNYWHGGLTALDKTDIEGESIYFGGKKFPIQYADLYNYYIKAIKFIRGDNNYSLEDIESQQKDAGNDFHLNKEYFQYKGLIYPNKPFTTKKIIEESEKNSGLSIVHGFDVKKINFSNSSKVISIEGYVNKEGDIKKINADAFVLCAGGFGSPKILLESAKEHKGLSDLPIGRYIIDHPSGFVFKAKLHRHMNLKTLFGQSANGYRVQNGFILNPDKLGIAELLNHIVFLRPAISMKDPLIYDYLKRRLVGYKGKKLKPSDIFYLFKHTDLLFDAINFKFGLFNSTKYVSGMTFIEQTPSEEGNITCKGKGRYSIKWKVSDKEAQSVEKFLKTFFRCHENYFENYEIFPNIRDRLDSSGHHSGGCRMSSSPSDGVVDSNLNVFGTDNLFTVDGSVLGYSGHANTGLTITALALKCVDIIKELG